ncbi:MAG: hypothetical protein ABIH21_01890 [Patescibacteria group bacterium]
MRLIIILIGIWDEPKTIQELFELFTTKDEGKYAYGSAISMIPDIENLRRSGFIGSDDSGDKIRITQDGRRAMLKSPEMRLLKLFFDRIPLENFTG